MTNANPAWACQIMRSVAPQYGGGRQKRKSVANRRKPISPPRLTPQQHGQLVRGTADGAGRRRAPTTGRGCGRAPLDDGWRVGAGTAWSRYPPPLRSIRCRRLAGHIGRMKELRLDEIEERLKQKMKSSDKIKNNENSSEVLKITSETLTMIRKVMDCIGRMENSLNAKMAEQADDNNKLDSDFDPLYAFRAQHNKLGED